MKRLRDTMLLLLFFLGLPLGTFAVFEYRARGLDSVLEAFAFFGLIFVMLSIFALAVGLPRVPKQPKE